MVIVMTPEATAEDVARVVEKVESVGGEAFVSKGVVRTIIGLVGDIESFHHLNLRSMPGVGDVHRISDPYKLVSRQHHRGPQHGLGARRADRPGHLHVHRRPVRRRVAGADARGRRDGQGRRRDADAWRCLQAAHVAVRLPGARRRGPGDPRRRCGRRPACRWSPRSSTPATSRWSPSTPTCSRSAPATWPTSGCSRPSASAGKPVLLKRGMTATIEEWLMAAEYIAQRGNLDVVLCERGIRTFEPATRNTLDISAVPVVQATSHLPIIVDPSHAAGRKDLVVPLSRAAIAVGADGVIVDVHPRPGDRALRRAAGAARRGPARARPGGAPAAAGRRPGGREHAVPDAGGAWLRRRCPGPDAGRALDGLEVAEAVLLRGLLAVDLALGDVGQEHLDGHAVAGARGRPRWRRRRRRRRWSRRRRRAASPLGLERLPAELVHLGDVGDALAVREVGLDERPTRRRRRAPPRTGRTRPPRRAAPGRCAAPRSRRSSRSSWVSSLVSSRQRGHREHLPQHGGRRVGLLAGDVEVGHHRAARAARPRTTSTPCSRTAATTAGASGTSTTTMLVCTAAGSTPQRLGEEPGVLVVVGQPLDVVVEGVQPRRRQHADLPHAAAEPLAPHPRLGDRRRRCPTTSEPTGAPSPLLRQTASTSAHARRTPRAGCRSRRARSRSGRRRGARRRPRSSANARGPPAGPRSG